MNDHKDYFLAVYQIIKVGHQITHQVSQKLKVYGVTEPQFNVLRILRGRKGIPLSVLEIQKNMIQRSSNVTRIIDKLEKKSLVERQQCEENRRKMDIVITDKGLEFLKQLDKAVQELHRPLMDNLTVKEARQLSHLIQKFTGTSI